MTLKVLPNEIIGQILLINKDFDALELSQIIDMNWACKNGHLEVVKYLHSVGKDCTTDDMDWASSNGHIEIVRFLHSINAKCTTYAMILASENGHLNVVTFLHMNKKCIVQHGKCKTTYTNSSTNKFIQELKFYI
jgi:ankyrin repeat protein